MPPPIAWADIEPHLDRALGLEPPARDSWLRELEATQPDIAKAVQALLTERAALNAAGFLERGPLSGIGELEPTLRAILERRAAHETGGLSIGTPDLEAGIVIGPYRLIREIGYGGMSSVWLAERSDQQLKREVALKLPLLGLRMHVERFARERDILAALTHPNIARLYDAGISDSGQPYLAMEYVAGTAFVRSCNERRLTIRARLALFLEVLQAVQFAHAELIIHRDLKPSNVLVTPQGRVALLDFGIAKLLTDGSVSETAPLTQMSGRALTPDYASPEQISNQALGTASDIYSLGVILYELLTGARPYRPKRDTRAALEESILAGELRRPSQSEFTAEAAADRDTSVRALMRVLKGDLDTIVLKALKKNPLDRYASVTAFAQDIDNYLQRLPVTARPDSNWYRVGRFVARHKIPVAASGLVLLALLGGAVLALWQAREAAAERDRAIAFAARNEAVSEFLGRVITEAGASEHPITVSDLLTRSEKLALGNTHDSPENRAAVLAMIAERYRGLDELDRALPLLKSAVALVKDSPDRTLRSRLACAYAAANADVGAAEAAIRSLRAEVGKLASDPATASYCLLELSRLFGYENRGDEALDAARSGLQRLRAAAKDSGVAEAALLTALATGHHLTGRIAEASLYFEQAMTKYTAMGRERSDEALVTLNGWAVMILSTGMPVRALSLFEQAERVELAREPGAKPSTTIVGDRALALMMAGRYADARPVFDLECQLAVERTDEFGELHCLLGRAQLEIMTKSLTAARADLERADGFMKSFPPASPPTLVRASLQGRLDLAEGHLGAARTQFASVLASGKPTPAVLAAGVGMAETELAANNPSTAVEHARRALRNANALKGNLVFSNFTGLASLALGRSLLALGDRANAEQALKTAVSQLAMTVDARHPALVMARELVAK